MLQERRSDSSQTSYESYEDDDKDDDDDEVEDSEEEPKTEVSDCLIIIEDDPDLPVKKNAIFLSVNGMKFYYVTGTSSETSYESYEDDDEDNDDYKVEVKAKTEDSEEKPKTEKTEVSDGLTIIEDDTDLPASAFIKLSPSQTPFTCIKADELEVKEEGHDRDDAAMETDRDGDDEGTGGEDRDGDDEGTGQDRDGDDEGTGPDRDGDDKETGPDRDGHDEGPDMDGDGDNKGTGLASQAKRPRLGEPKRKPRQCPLCEGMFVRLATHLTDSHNVTNRDNRLQLLNQAPPKKSKGVGRERGQKGGPFVIVRSLAARQGHSRGSTSTSGGAMVSKSQVPQLSATCQKFHNCWPQGQRFQALASRKSSQEYLLWLAAARATVPETDPPSPEKAKPSAHSKIPKKLNDKAVLDRFLSYEAAMVGGTGPNLKQAEQHRRQVEILLQRLEVNSIAGLVDPLSVQRLNEEVSRSAGVKPKAAKRTDLATEQFQVALRPEIDRHGRKIASQIKDSILSSAEIGKLKRLATKEGIAMAENTDSILQSSVAINRFRDLLMAMHSDQYWPPQRCVTEPHRRGILAGRAVLSAGWVGEMDNKNHKTLKSHGPTHITIEQTTYNLMLVYLMWFGPSSEGSSGDRGGGKGHPFLPLKQREPGAEAEGANGGSWVVAGPFNWRPPLDGPGSHRLCLIPSTLRGAEKEPTAEGEPSTTAKKPMKGTTIQSAPQREPAAEGEPATAEEITRKKTTIPCVPQSEPAAKIQPTAEGEPATVQQDGKEEDEKKPKVHVKSFPVFPEPTSDCPLCSQAVKPSDPEAQHIHQGVSTEGPLPVKSHEVQGAERKNSDLNKSGALEGLINAKISEVDGLNIPEGAMVFQPQLIPALVNVTRRYGTERSTDLIEEGTGVWLYLNTSSGEPWSRRLLTERKAGLP
ncbi:hypothetical protein BSL78_10140 [Apostichopus japonicus]|uniref:Uncharacterized protein n=1 Tax=Stichopus japonicus TaxID=307972 RepID=A0A2G8KY95_STIJA|nr:hypothetical protein BSL78_10140 [Apostichopus japonicus]